MESTYRIDKIVKVKHDDGRIEIVPYDTTIELLALELEGMGLSFPISEEDEEAIFEHFVDLDVEIGQVESDGIWPTRKYDEQVCRAVDEFNIEEDEGYIDYGSLNRRLEEVLSKIEAGTLDKHVKIKWRKGTLPLKERDY